MITQNQIVLGGKSILPSNDIPFQTNVPGVTMNNIEKLNHPITPISALSTGMPVNGSGSSGGNSVLLHPIVTPYYTSGAVNKAISVDVFALFPANRIPEIAPGVIDRSRFSYRYDLNLEFGSEYQLSIYISTTDEELSEHPNLPPDDEPIFDLLHFSFEFMTEAFDDFFSPVPSLGSASNGKINLCNIKTVKVFLVSQASESAFFKQFKFTLADVQNIIEENLTVSSPLIVPGLFINSSDSSSGVPTAKFISSAPPPEVNNFPTLPIPNQLLSPLITAFRDPVNKNLTITIAALLQQSLGLINPNEFSFFYTIHPEDSSIVTESSGEQKIQSTYKLNLYVTFNKQELEGNSNVLEAFYFDVVFGPTIDVNLPNSVHRLPNVETSFINTVEVFIVNTDPETSRGTETTVQEGGGNG